MALVQAVPGQALELQFGHTGEPGSLLALSAEEFARRANERLEGRAEVVLFGAGQLGSDSQLLQRLKLGTLDFALPSTIMSGEVELIGLFEMPYLVSDREHMGRIEQEVFWPSIAPGANDVGLEIVAVWENGFRHITNNLRPIDTPEDLAGMRIRTPPSAWRLRMFEAYGASPSPLSFTELFLALQTGVFDGQENPLSQIHSARFQEVQRYLTLTNHTYTPAYLVTGATRWASHDPEIREILTEVARETQAYVYETAERLEGELLELLIADGMQVNEADRVSFVEASQPVYEAFAAEVEGAAELIARALELSEAP